MKVICNVFLSRPAPPSVFFVCSKSLKIWFAGNCPTKSKRNKMEIMVSAQNSNKKWWTQIPTGNKGGISLFHPYIRLAQKHPKQGRNQGFFPYFLFQPSFFVVLLFLLCSGANSALTPKWLQGGGRQGGGRHESHE